jgi:hypothetical protein
MTHKSGASEQSIEGKLRQYDAFKAEIRDYDKLIWGTPSISAAITGLSLNIVFGQSATADSLIRSAVLALAAMVNFALFRGVIKHRFFQQQLNTLIDQLEPELGMISQPKTTSQVLTRKENKFRGYLYGKRAYYSLASTQASLFAVLPAAMAYILSNSGIVALATFGVGILTLYMLVF